MWIKPPHATLCANQLIECAMLEEPPSEELCEVFCLTTSEHTEALFWCILQNSITQTDLIKSYKNPSMLNSLIQRTSIEGSSNPFSKKVTFV